MPYQQNDDPNPISYKSQINTVYKRNRRLVFLYIWYSTLAIWQNKSPITSWHGEFRVIKEVTYAQKKREILMNHQPPSFDQTATIHQPHKRTPTPNMTEQKSYYKPTWWGSSHKRSNICTEERNTDGPPTSLIWSNSNPFIRGFPNKPTPPPHPPKNKK